MKQVQQHPDGFVYVRVDGQPTYGDTASNFMADFGLTLPALPAGYTERIYDQGARHTLAGSNEFGAFVKGGPMPWPIGDQAIANIATGLANQEARIPPDAKTGKKLRRRA